MFKSNKTTIIITILLFYQLCLTQQYKFSKLQVIQLTKFLNLTNISLCSSIQQFQNQQNLLVYFNNKQDFSPTQFYRQFESTRSSFLKASKYQRLKQIQTSREDQNQQHIQTNLDKYKIKHNYKADFYAVTWNRSNQLCQKLGLSTKQQKVLYFSKHQQVIQYIGLPQEKDMIFFLTKLRQNSNYGRRKVDFDDQLIKISVLLPYQSSSIQQIIFVKINQYLKFDVILFIIVFLICPFSFGYISTKIRQRQQRKILYKYGQKNQLKKKEN